MIMVWFAVFPAMFWGGMYNSGHQAVVALNHMYQGAQLAEVIAGNWHYWLVEAIGGTVSSEAGWGGSMMLLGATYFLPIYGVVFAVGGFWEVLFCIVRKHEVNEGFFLLLLSCLH